MRYRVDDEAVQSSAKPLINREETVTDQHGKETWVSTTKVPLHDTRGTIVGLVGICHDITERKQSQDQIEALNRDLQRRAKEFEAVNQELEAFSYSVSHDLRAPLRHIDGFAALLLKSTGAQLDDKGRRFLNKISQAAKDMGQLIDDLPSFLVWAEAPCS